ncbi:MAG: hypothetical protein Q8Q22_00425 [bacterium]|nr:hypothetical protein [bacterium]
MVWKRKKQKQKDDRLGFITDGTLRADIKIALGFSSYLVRNSAKAKKHYRRELRRVVILYVASVVEALCLFLISRSSLSKEKMEYKNAHVIKIPDIVLLPKGKVLVVALQEKIPLSLTDTPFFDAINILRGGRIVTTAFAERLHTLREKRNSQHLYNRASKHISATDVNQAFSALQGLFRIIQKKI